MHACFPSELLIRWKIAVWSCTFHPCRFPLMMLKSSINISQNNSALCGSSNRLWCGVKTKNKKELFKERERNIFLKRSSLRLFQTEYPAKTLCWIIEEQSLDKASSGKSEYPSCSSRGEKSQNVGENIPFCHWSKILSCALERANIRKVRVWERKKVVSDTRVQKQRSCQSSGKSRGSESQF